MIEPLAPYVPWIVALGIAIVWGLLRHQRQRTLHEERLRTLEQRHAERLAAIQQGLLDPSLDEPLVPAEDPAREAMRAERRLLLAGIVLVAGGAGAWLGMSMVPATDQTAGLAELASIALAPLSLGVGVLAYVLLARRLS